MALAVLAIICALQLRDNVHNWGDDFAAYILEAKAIVDGRVEAQGAQNVALHPSFLFSNNIQEMSHLYYVWGLPLMLTPVLKLLPADADVLQQIFWLKVPGCICLGILAYCAYLFYSRRMSPKLSLLLTLLLVGGVLDETNFIHTDLPEMTFALACFLLFELCEDNPKGWFRYAALGFCMYMVWTIRLNGLSVVLYIGALCAVSCLRHRRVEWKWLISFCVFGVLCLIQNAFLPRPTSNTGDVGQLISFDYFLYNIVCCGQWMWYLLRFRSVWLHILSSGILALLTLWGLVRFAFRREIRYTIFIVGTYLVVSMLPYGQGARYYMSILPFLVLFIGMAMQDIWQWLSKKMQGRADSGKPARLSVKHWKQLLTAVAVFLLINSCFAVYRQAEEDVLDERKNGFMPAAMEAYDYIRENTAPDARVAFLRPRLLAFAAQRQGFNPELSIYNPLDADYFLQNKYPEYSIPLAEETLSRMTTVFENEGFVLYMVNAE